MAGPEKRLNNSKSGLRMVTVDASDSSPFILDEPQWVPDDECQYCQSCRAKFDFLRRRRHHCRRCGKCFCNKCCEEKVELPRMCFVDPVRQCQICRELSRKESDFFDRSLKSLLTGGRFSVTDSDQTPEESSCFAIKLSPNHRQLIFDGDSDKHEPVLIEKMESLQVLAAGKDDDGNTIAGGIALKYKDSTGTSNVVKLMVESGAFKKQGQIWLAAMQKAFRLVCDVK